MKESISLNRETSKNYQHQPNQDPDNENMIPEQVQFPVIESKKCSKLNINNDSIQEQIPEQVQNDEINKNKPKILIKPSSSKKLPEESKQEVKTEPPIHKSDQSQTITHNYHMTGIIERPSILNELHSEYKNENDQKNDISKGEKIENHKKEHETISVVNESMSKINNRSNNIFSNNNLYLYSF